MWRERPDSKARDVLRDRQMTRASFLSFRMVAGYLEVIKDRTSSGCGGPIRTE
jgi:hypothetical protein